MSTERFYDDSLKSKDVFPLRGRDKRKVLEIGDIFAGEQFFDGFRQQLAERGSRLRASFETNEWFAPRRADIYDRVPLDEYDYRHIGSNTRRITGVVEDARHLVRKKHPRLVAAIILNQPYINEDRLTMMADRRGIPHKRVYVDIVSIAAVTGRLTLSDENDTPYY